jgi:hypothetical protein
MKNRGNPRNFIPEDGRESGVALLCSRDSAVLRVLDEAMMDRLRCHFCHTYILAERDTAVRL